ncbi:MAG: winged helix-turn-helix domain-containing protein [Methanobacteriota archaeon]
MVRRERWALVGSILEAIEEERERGGERARVTNVANRANLAYDRHQLYLANLSAAGLIEANGSMPHLTDRGADFLRRYREWLAYLNEIGLPNR